MVRLPAVPGSRFEEITRRTGGRVHRVRLGNLAMSGGYDIVFECLGSRQSIGESLKWTRSRGQVVLVGTGAGGVDLTPIWFNELRVVGAYGRQIETFEGRRVGTYQLVHEWMSDGRLNARGLLTHVFRIGDYRRALAVAADKSRHLAIKVAIDFREKTPSKERA